MQQQHHHHHHHKPQEYTTRVPNMGVVDSYVCSASHHPASSVGSLKRKRCSLLEQQQQQQQSLQLQQQQSQQYELTEGHQHHHLVKHNHQFCWEDLPQDSNNMAATMTTTMTTTMTATTATTTTPLVPPYHVFDNVQQRSQHGQKRMKLEHPSPSSPSSSSFLSYGSSPALVVDNINNDHILPVVRSSNNTSPHNRSESAIPTALVSLFEIMPVDTLLHILEFYEFPLYRYWPRFYHREDDEYSDSEDDDDSEEEDEDDEDTTTAVRYREKRRARILAGTQLADNSAQLELIRLLYGYFPSRIAHHHHHHHHHTTSNSNSSFAREIYFVFPCISIHDYSISMACEREPYFMLQLINSVIRIRNLKMVDLSGWQHSELNLYDPSRSPNTIKWNIHQIKSDDDDDDDDYNDVNSVNQNDTKETVALTTSSSSKSTQPTLIHLCYNGVVLDRFSLSSSNSTIRHLYAIAASILKKISPSSYISYEKRPFKLIKESENRLLNPDVDDYRDIFSSSTAEIINLEFDCNLVMDSLEGLEIHSVYDEDDNDIDRAHLFISCAPKLQVVRLDYTKEESFGPSLKTLRISSYEATGSQFISFIHRCPNITELTLRGSTLTADSLQHLAHLHHLKRMNLASENCKEPIRLPISPHLVSLKLSDGITLDEETSVALIRDNRLTELKFLFDSGMHERGFDYFEQNTSLVRIISNMENFWVKGIERIVRNQSIRTVKVIIPGNKYVEDVLYRSENPLIRNLTYLKMGYDSVLNEEIADAIVSKTRNLNRITFGTNSYMCSRSVHRILTQLPKLDRVKLTHTHVDDSVNHAFFQDVRVQVLQLHACSMTTASLATLSENWTLKRLILRHNRIGDEGACAIIQNCKVLEILDLANNGLTERFLPCLKQYNRTIRWLRLGVLKGLKRHACDVVKEFDEITHFEVVPDPEAL